MVDWQELDDRMQIALPTEEPEGNGLGFGNAPFGRDSFGGVDTRGFGFDRGFGFGQGWFGMCEGGPRPKPQVTADLCLITVMRFADWSASLELYLRRDKELVGEAGGLSGENYIYAGEIIFTPQSESVAGLKAATQLQKYIHRIIDTITLMADDGAYHVADGEAADRLRHALLVKMAKGEF